MGSNQEDLGALGPCWGTLWVGNNQDRLKQERCPEQALHKHITPEGRTYFFCDECEATVMRLLDAGKRRAVNQFIFGGRRTTGLRNGR